jgi:hypothetical protein
LVGLKAGVAKGGNTDVEKVMQDLRPKLKAKAEEAVKEIVKKTLESVKVHLSKVKGKVGDDLKKFLLEHSKDAMRLIAQIAERENASKEE